MKKFSFIFVLGLLSLSFNSFSQIKVNSSGEVGINQNYPAYNLDWYGTGRYWSTGWGQFIFDNSGSGGVATMHPNDDWVGCLGTSTKRFNNIYVDHLVARAVTETSDETMKENIKQLDSSLEKIKKLKGVKYDLKKEYFKTNNSKADAFIEKERKNEIGFLAQDLLEIFPEVVYLDETNNLYSVSYSRLVPVLVEAIKEQQDQIDDFVKRLEKLESKK